MKSELEVSDDLINDFMILDKGDNRHPTPTLRTDKRVYLIEFFYHLCPASGRHKWSLIFTSLQTYTPYKRPSLIQALFAKMSTEVDVGRIVESTNEHFAQAAKIMRDHLVIFLNIVDEAAEKEQVIAKKEIPYFSQIDLLQKSIEHLELSVRSSNCLRSAGIQKIYELVQKTEDEFLQTKNFCRLGEKLIDTSPYIPLVKSSWRLIVNWTLVGFY